MKKFWVGLVAVLALSTPVMAQDTGRRFQEFTDSLYSNRERACTRMTNVERGWCYEAEAARRDVAIQRLVVGSASQAERSYQAAWLRYRAYRCAASREGSGSGSIAARCKLDMAIARQAELEAELN